MTRITRRGALKLGAGSLLAANLMGPQRAKAQPLADVDVIVIVHLRMAEQVYKLDRLRVHLLRYDWTCGVQ